MSHSCPQCLLAPELLMALTFGQGIFFRNHIRSLFSSVNLLSKSEQLCNCQTFFASLARYSTASARHLNSFGLPFIFFRELSASFALTIPEISARWLGHASDHPGVALQPVGPNELPAASAASVSIKKLRSMLSHAKLKFRSLDVT